ncbi:MAG: hypothetical protein V8Q40_04755 [Anaerosacchariphilus sp.]
MRTGVIILIILILCVAGYGAAKSGKLKLPKLGKTDPLGIEHIVIGSCEADVTEEEGVWYIDLAVDEDFSSSGQPLTWNCRKGPTSPQTPTASSPSWAASTWSTLGYRRLPSQSRMERSRETTFSDE